jgi:hypothetical protein
VLVPWACAAGSELPIRPANFAALALVALAAGLGWRDWRRVGAHVSDESAAPRGRARFLTMLGLMLSALFGLVIKAQAMGAAVFDPCQQ